MHTPAKIGLGALVSVGAVAAVYRIHRSRIPQSRSIPYSTDSTESQKCSTSQDLASPDHEAQNRKHRAESQQHGNIGGAAQDAELQRSQWNMFSEKLAATKDSVASSIATLSVTSILPDWSLGLPDWITRLQKELNMEPGSLASVILEEARDTAANPELAWDATVRQSQDLCAEERRFMEKRRKFTRRALALYLGIPEEDIHLDDVPVIATTGSGGGIRAMIASTGYYQALQEAGLFDCVSYTAGVSGTCWLQSLFLSSLGQQSFQKVAEHLKDRVGVHIAYPPKALELLEMEPTNKYLLRGLIEKVKIGSSSLNLVDIYGVLLGARLLVPKDERSVNPDDLKLSHQRVYLDEGKQPMPIYTAVRHEIPGVGAENEVNTTIDDNEKQAAIKKDEHEGEAWFQWFEISPYEVYCEDLEAGIPTWSLGRKFENGRNIGKDIPELKLPLLFGIFGSAFCATLSHYYQEIRPLLTSIRFLNRLDDMVLQVNDSLTKLHPIDPATVPNFVKGLGNSLPSTCPSSLYEAENIQLMDAGMSNNLGCYPLMRKGRDVDIVIAFDSSADIQTANWISYTSGYAKQRQIQGWPVSLGWPQADDEEAVEQLERAQAESAEQAEERLEHAKSKDPGAPETVSAASAAQMASLGRLTVWVGSKEARESDLEPPPSTQAQHDWELMRPEAGVVVAYFPFISNPNVPNVDPEISPYLSTWNFEWTPEQVDSTIALAKANFNEEADRMKKVVRAVYERKKRSRLQKEQQTKDSSPQ